LRRLEKLRLVSTEPAAAQRDAMGMHGTLFYELDFKKPYYPTLRDEEAVNPGGSRLR